MTRSNSLLLYRALPAALLLHLVLLALIPPLARAPSSRNVEFLAFVRSIPIRIERPVPHPAAAAPAARAPLAPHTVTHSVAKKVAIARVQSAPIAAAIPSAGVTVRVSPAPPSAVVVPSAAPQTTQSALPAKNVAQGYMPLGADEPVPVLDPAVRKALLALGIHVTLTIDVDANGHTKSVAFSPAIDPNDEQRIRELLASATWDPAVCGGGEGCEGQAVVRL